MASSENDAPRQGDGCHAKIFFCKERLHDHLGWGRIRMGTDHKRTHHHRRMVFHRLLRLEILHGKSDGENWEEQEEARVGPQAISSS